MYFCIGIIRNTRIMHRNIIEQLKVWKNKKGRKPLVLAGARQVGKTYILKHFGEQEFANVAYINCDNNELARNLFSEDYDMRRILLAIGAITGQSIEAGKTLIILDEIQEAPRGLSVLKYFYENAPQYHVAVAGSLLGIAMHRGESFPVGKVDVLHIYPMTFDEFLLAKGKKQMVDILRAKDWATVKLLKNEYVKSLREYYFVGGMPEAVAEFVSSNDARKVRTVQNNILFTYRQDMSKHVSASEANRIGMDWQSMPSQLVKENKNNEDMYIRDPHNALYYCGRKYGVMLEHKMRDSYLNQLLDANKIELTDSNNRIADTGLFWGNFSINFIYHANGKDLHLQWYRQRNNREYDIYLMTEDWNYMRRTTKLENEQGDRQDFYCFNIEKPADGISYIEYFCQLVETEFKEFIENNNI